MQDEEETCEADEAVEHPGETAKETPETPGDTAEDTEETTGEAPVVDGAEG